MNSEGNAVWKLKGRHRHSNVFFCIHLSSIQIYGCFTFSRTYAVVSFQLIGKNDLGIRDGDGDGDAICDAYKPNLNYFFFQWNITKRSSTKYVWNGNILLLFRTRNFFIKRVFFDSIPLIRSLENEICLSFFLLLGLRPRYSHRLIGIKLWNVKWQ